MARRASPQRCRLGRRATGAAAVVGSCLVLHPVGPSAAQDEPDLVPVERREARGTDSGEPAPQVALDDLLRLPSGYAESAGRKGGATAPEWRARFAAARTRVSDAEKELERLDKELGALSQDASAWSVAAPGSSDPQSGPLNLRLRQQIKDQKAAIEEAERDLRALEVEADLAAVPPDWRQ